MLWSLQPFTPLQDLPDLRLTVRLSRRSDTVTLSYTISGPVEELLLPSRVKTPFRRGGLWEETCLEFFVTLRDSQPYWEVNLSPSGHWNVYRFSSYRQGMREEAALTSLPFRTESEKASMRLDVEFPLGGIVPSKSLLQAAVSAVIKLRGGQLTYWALHHPGREPDFHRREAFIAEL